MDLFPHTRLCEVVLLMERMNNDGNGTSQDAGNEISETSSNETNPNLVIDCQNTFSGTESVANHEENQANTLNHPD